MELARQGAGLWTLETPLHAAGDDLTVENLIGQLQAAQMKSIVADTATDLTKYGSTSRKRQ